MIAIFAGPDGPAYFLPALLGPLVGGMAWRWNVGRFFVGLDFAAKINRVSR